MLEMQTYCLYGGTAALSLLLCRYSEINDKKRGLITAAILLIVVSGFRAYTVGVDTSLYKTSVELFFDRGETLRAISFAYGYGVFTRFLLSLNYNYTFLLVVQAAITNGLILARFWDLRKNCSLTFMLFIYITTTYFYTLCIVCQYLAVALVFWGSRFADKGKYPLYIAVILVAASLHISALIAFIDVVVRLMRLKGTSPFRMIVRFLALASILVAGVYGVRLLWNRYSAYMGNVSSIGLMVFMQVFALVAGLCVCGYFSRRSEPNGLFLRSELRECAPYALPLYVLGLLLSAASYVVANAGRIAYYFTIYGCVCFGAMAKHSGTSRIRFVCAMFLVVWHVAYCIQVFFINTSLGIVPYSFVWG